MADETPTDTAETWPAWRARIGAARKRREDLVPLWQENVDARRGRMSETEPAADRVSVNKDWSLSKAKIAQLYSQTPEVRLSPRDDVFQQAVPQFARRLNDTIADSDVGSIIEEVLSDVVNAAGIGAVLVSCDHRTEMRDLPVVDVQALPPKQQAQVMSGAIEIPTQPAPAITDIKYPVQRISPTDLLIPSDFTGSVYDQARWLGHDGRMTWPQAVLTLGLTDEQKSDVLGQDKRKGSTHTLNTDTTKFLDTEVVNFTEIFYWRHFYHQEETSFVAIQRVVFVDGIDEPVINEAYAGQERLEEEDAIVGMRKLPIRVLTLTYISDDSLPPSDSSIGRFQVEELVESRDAMVQQRKHSIPLRWGDTNRIAANTRTKIEEGNFQGFIWTNGDGSRAIGEVSRASFPQERFDFDRVINSDLTETWQVGTNQAGAFASGERSAREAQIIQQNFQTRIGQERDKVTRFFVGIAECLAGLLALYDDRDLALPEGIPREAIANGFVYTVRVDSTVLLNASDRIEQLTRALNLTAQSGYVNPKAAIEEIWELSGVDPSKVVIDPEPKPPEPVKVSVSSAEDVMNPVMLSLLMRTGQAGTPEDLAASVKAIQAVLAGMLTGVVPAPPPTEGGTPAEGIAHPEIASPDWEASPRVERRADDGGA